MQAVIDTTLLALDVDAARRAAATEIDVCAAVATHLAAQVKSLSRTIAVRSLGNVPQKLAFDILERACRRQVEIGRLEARATHFDLADSIGSSREVVSRALKDLRVAGIVETLPGVVRVSDPRRLAAIVRGFEFQLMESVA